MQAEISLQVRRAAYEIIERKGATFYAIGLSIRQIVEAILRNQNTVLSVSTLVDGTVGGLGRLPEPAGHCLPRRRRGRAGAGPQR